MLVWFAVYSLHWHIPLNSFSPISWHAHEMIYGYGGAVVAGFLLTAVRNWTDLPTLAGTPLIILALLWLLARLLPFVPAVPIDVIGLLDIGFYLFLLAAIGGPLVKAKQWRNMGVLAIIGLIMASNILYYLGLMSIYQQGISLGIYSGFYLLTGLVLLMCRRLIPLFTTSGIGYEVALKNSLRLDRLVLLLFFLFWISELVLPNHLAGAVLAAVLAIMHATRWAWWHRIGIWKKPLLWVLFIAYGFLIIGFSLRAVSAFLPISSFISLHAFAVGGIGMVTMGMMSRVTLGHTGRVVNNPPPVLGLIFGLMLLAGITRVLFPLFDPDHYLLWVSSSQVFWILGFAGFLLIFAPMLVQPRADGNPG